MMEKPGVNTRVKTGAKTATQQENRPEDNPKNKIKPQVVGILNATDNSFSGDGLIKPDAAGASSYFDTILRHAQMMQEAGAAIIDIGGESTNPLAVPIDEAEETARVQPVIKILHQTFPDLPLSIDTYKPSVARMALEAGCTILNDVSGGADPEMLALAKQADCPIILMHNRARQGDIEVDQMLGGSFQAPETPDFYTKIIAEMAAIAKRACLAGVKASNIILDPGIGFGKTVQQNLMLINQTKDLSDRLSYPLLIGASRKNFIGKILNERVDQRLAGSLAVAVIAALRGADYIRVHDVRETVQALTMIKAIETPETYRNLS